MNNMVNSTFRFVSGAKSNMLSSVLRPALVLALSAGVATPAFAQDAEDGGAFGLLQAFAQQGEPADEAFGDVEYDETQNADDPNLGEDDLANFEGAVEVSEYDIVDLHVNNEDLGNILQLLSIQSQRNIISSNAVQATVTADLYGVTFYEALDAILHVNGFGYIEKGNFIYVYTRAELEEFELAMRKPVAQIVHLDFLNSADAAEFAKELLSESGSISTHAATKNFTISEGSPAGADTYASTASIVIHDFEENVEEIVALLSELDTKPAQILVEATILQTALNEANAFGVDFALIKNLNFTDFVGTGGPLSVIDGLISGKGQTVDGTNVNASDGSTEGSGGVSSSVGNTAGPATLKAGLVNGDVAVFLRVLDEVTDVTIVSNPKILTLNRQPARVLVGTRVGYLNTTSTQTATTQTVEFLEVGTELAVRPFVTQNGWIRLELRPQVSSFTLRSITDGTGATITIPDEDTTEMTTNVMVRDSQTVVLGGLFTETTTATRRQVPLLGNIPMIGQAFRGNEDSTRRSEIIFLITPSIVNDSFLAEAGDRGNEFVEHARFGARKGLLPWSRERRVGQILINARHLADEGQTEKAMSKIDQALRLQPNSPDARAMRTELTGEIKMAPSRAMIQTILHGELLEGYQVQSEAVDAPVAEDGGVEVIEWAEPENIEVDEAEIAEVPEQLSDASGDMTHDEVFDEAFDTISEMTDDASFEVADADFQDHGHEGLASVETGEAVGYTQIFAEDFDSAELASEMAASDEAGFEVEAFEMQDAGTDTVGAEVAGSETFESEPILDESFDLTPYIEVVDNTEQQMPEHQMPEPQGEGQWSYEEFAPGIAVEQDFDSICGQLIISLPGGGALTLDWPLSASDWTTAESSTSVEDGESMNSDIADVPSSDFE